MKFLILFLFLILILITIIIHNNYIILFLSFLILMKNIDTNCKCSDNEEDCHQNASLTSYYTLMNMNKK